MSSWVVREGSSEFPCAVFNRAVTWETSSIRFDSHNRLTSAVGEMFSKCPLLDLHTGASVFTDGKGYDFVYPWKSKKQQ